MTSVRDQAVRARAVKKALAQLQGTYGLAIIFRDYPDMIIAARLGSIFLADPDGHRPCHGGDARYARDPHFRDLVLFHEYFHGETGRGVGASHQTGWTALAIRFIEDTARTRARAAETRQDPAARLTIIRPDHEETLR